MTDPERYVDSTNPGFSVEDTGTRDPERTESAVGIAEPAEHQPVLNGDSSDDVFQPFEAEPADMDESANRQDRRVRIPGPGLPEAVLWMIGVLVVHFVGIIITVSVIVATQMNGGFDPAALQQFATDLLANYGMELIVGEMVVFVLCAVLFSMMRLGFSGRRLGVTSLPLSQLALIVAVAVPLSLMCGTLHQWSMEAWEIFAGNFPALEAMFNNTNVNETLKPLAERTPLWLLILAIALAPAIGEEIVFRGVIGRGLVARYGVVSGVILTSLMFAAVHVHPAHVVALLPLAFFMHFVYLTTRSFWAPVLLHLLNNSLAAVLLKLSGLFEVAESAQEEELPIAMFAAATAIVVVCSWALWKNRVVYRMPDGTDWNPGYATVEAPPLEAGAVSVRPHENTGFSGFAMVSGLLFTGVFVASLVMETMAQ